MVNDVVGGRALTVPVLPLFTVFGMDEGGEMYWTVVLALAFVIVGIVLANQIASDTLILKE